MSSVLECTPADLVEGADQESIEAWDSLRHVSLIMALEQEFNFEISDDDADSMTTYVAVRRVVASHAP